MGKMLWGIIGTAALIAAPAAAQDMDGSNSVAATTPSTLERKLDEALERIGQQQKQLDRQAAEIAELRRQLLSGISEAGGQPTAPAIAAGPQGSAAASTDVASGSQAPIPLERVGQAPEDVDRPIELAVLDTQGSVVTRRGQLTGEVQFDYTRADRNRAVFRGVELIEAVLVGVFDINESRQDILTESLALRYGVTDRLEVGARIPLVYRSDTSIIAPVAGSTQDDTAATIDSSVKGSGVGDLELTARYQLIDGSRGNPYVIANLQGVFPTGSDPFAIPRDTLGRPSRATTGAGFYSVSPSLTAILPSDPVVLFGTLGYAFNLGKSVDTIIPPVNIDYVDPGDAISASAGIGISFNQRTTLNLGYAHSWAFGTRTRTRLLDPGPNSDGVMETTSRDLQLGRLLFGVTYRATDRASINWSVDIGATEDAPDLRTTIRVPITLFAGDN